MTRSYLQDFVTFQGKISAAQAYAERGDWEGAILALEDALRKAEAMGKTLRMRAAKAKEAARG